MKKNTEIFLLALCLAVLSAGFLGFYPKTVHGATNILSDTGKHWAWNDIIGWIDHYNTLNINVETHNLTGYASSSVGYISLDCATSPDGDICGSSNYKVLNYGDGSLSGWAWNDEIGWISFCGGSGTPDCPGVTGYQVSINPNTGVFTGWAWNDVVGWVSFNCSNVPGSCATSQYHVETTWTATSTTGYLESTTFDTGVSGGATINSVMWIGYTPSNTTVNFRFAASNSSSGPWNYATSTDYLVPACSSVASCANIQKVDYQLNNNRYFRYRATLTSDAAQRNTPRVDEIIVNWSP